MKVDKKNEEQLIGLLRSGNFTFQCNDNGWVSIIKGKVEQESDDEHKNIPLSDEEYGFGMDEDCCMPEPLDLIWYLVKALNGNFIITP